MSDNMNMAELMAVVTSIPRSAAAEAVEAAHLAQEVKESIPEDYSELSADVAEIKGAYAAKTDTVLETTLSRGRKSGTTVGSGSFAFGDSVEASGQFSFAEGGNTIASGNQSHAEGRASTASGNYSHAEGSRTNANGSYSHAEGSTTIANGPGSHAEGASTIASGICKHVFGVFNDEDNWQLYPEWAANTSYEVGDKVKVTTTTNDETTIQGYICKTANSDAEFTSAKWDQDSKRSFIEQVGNGTNNNNRSNVRALTWEGDERLAGDVYVGCNADSTGGTKLVKDVQVDGTSVLSDGVANVPLASSSTPGVVRVNSSRGFEMDGDALTFKNASEAQLKAGTNQYRPITPSTQYAASFYGLAKAAGDSTLSASDNPIGTYTADAIDKILAMLGVIDMVAPHEASSTASKAYSVGDAFIYAGKLYKVTDDIASGGTITPDTNCTQTTLVELMKG